MHIRKDDMTAKKNENKDHLMIIQKLNDAVLIKTNISYDQPQYINYDEAICDLHTHIEPVEGQFIYIIHDFHQIHNMLSNFDHCSQIFYLIEKNNLLA